MEPDAFLTIDWKQKYLQVDKLVQKLPCYQRAWLNILWNNVFYYN